MDLEKAIAYVRARGDAIEKARLADLERKHRPDGSWAPEAGEGEQHAANATLGALRALKG
jgi:hypothetical protein